MSPFQEPVPEPVTEPLTEPVSAEPETAEKSILPSLKLIEAVAKPAPDPLISLKELLLALLAKQQH